MNSKQSILHYSFDANENFTKKISLENWEYKFCRDEGALKNALLEKNWQLLILPVGCVSFLENFDSADSELIFVGQFNDSLPKNAWVFCPEKLLNGIAQLLAWQEQISEWQNKYNEEYLKNCHVSRLATLAQVAPSIAHEIRQPLTQIRLIMQSLELKYKKGVEVEQAELLSKINDVKFLVDKIALISDNMQNFSRRDNGQKQKFLMEHPLRKAISFFNEGLQMKSIVLQLQIDENMPSILGNAQKFEQIIVNLLSNAKHAVEEEGRLRGHNFQKKIDVRLYSNKEGNILSVRDNGIGMNDSLRRQCTEAFFTTKNPDSGLGLGMSIVSDLCKEFDAKLDISSTPHKGTVMKITF